MGMTPKRAKEHCGYNPAPVHPICSNCAAFRFDMKLPAWMQTENTIAAANGAGPNYTIEKHGLMKNMRCADHGFATKKTAACRLWKPKEGTPA